MTDVYETHCNYNGGDPRMNLDIFREADEEESGMVGEGRFMTKKQTKQLQRQRFEEDDKDKEDDERYVYAYIYAYMFTDISITL
jgi:hypothetical protein